MIFIQQIKITIPSGSLKCKAYYQVFKRCTFKNNGIELWSSELFIGILHLVIMDGIEDKIIPNFIVV